MAEAYGHAEKRIGSGDVAPKSAEDYKVNIPAALADKVKAEDIAADPKMKDFLAKAHAEGLTQKQVDFMVGEHLARSLDLQGALKVLSAQECTAELRKSWTTDADYSAGVQRAFRAAEAYAGEDLDGFMQAYGNDPRIVSLLAAVGAELSEDRAAPGGAGGVTTQATLDSLVKSKAYMDPMDPAHTTTKQQVERLMQQLHGTGAKRSGPIVISSV